MKITENFPFTQHGQLDKIIKMQINMSNHNKLQIK